MGSLRALMVAVWIACMWTVAGYILGVAYVVSGVAFILIGMYMLGESRRLGEPGLRRWGPIVIALGIICIVGAIAKGAGLW